ncbi:MAG: polyprenyl synthetase family protein [Firmicutes bacterium]|nr:polyprenyl synthetase family protein [Bacillota bacterium]
MKYAPETAVMELAPFVARVQEKLGEVLSGEGSIEEILAYIQQTNGKMIRPILLSLVYEMCGGTDSSVVLDVAAGIELIHIASLIHDDIVDQSDLRRNALTVQRRFGPQAAVLAGDYLFAKAFMLLTQHKPNQVLSVLTGVITQMCEGEIQQLMNPGCDEAHYWRYIYQKTAYFIQAVCEIGAMITEHVDQKAVTMMGKFGLALGYAYQLTDDLLDYSDHASVTGKNVGNDFMLGIWTLPIIRGVKQGILSSDWRQTLTFEDARNLLAGEGILSDIKKEAQFYVGQALSILDEFADNMARKQLKALAEFIGIRSC